MAGSPARKEVARVGVKVVPDTSDFGKELKAELARWSNEKINIEVTGDFASFEAELQKATEDRKVKVEVELDDFQAEAEMQAFLQDRTVTVNLDLDTSAASAQIAAITKAETKPINIDVDAGAAEAKIKNITRTETKKVQVDVDGDSLNQTTNVINTTVKNAGGVISGLGDALGKVLGGIKDIGSAAFSAFGALVSEGSGATEVMGKVQGAVLGIVTGVAQLGGAAAVIAAIIAALGALIVAAGAAVVSLAGVIIGAGALLALPILLGAVALALANTSKELKDAGNVFKEEVLPALGEIAEVMADDLASAFRTMNDALKEGTPLYDALAGAFDGASQAIAPLTRGIIDFTTQALGGISEALSNLNEQGFWDQIAVGFDTLGQAFGEFFVKLSEWGPELAAGFNGLAESMLLMLPAVANLSGAFASFAPEVLTDIGQAFADLFNAMAANKDVYGDAAKAFAAGLRDMAPALEQVAAAFAKMAPEVIFTLAAAVQRFADALSDESTVSGLTTLAQVLIDVGTNALIAATNVAAGMGRVIDDVATGWDKLTGVIKDSATVTKEDLQGLVDQADSSFEAATNLAKQLNTSIGVAEAEVIGKIGNIAEQWRSKIDEMNSAGQEGSAAINESFVARFQELQQNIEVEGGRITQAWKDKLQQLIAETQASSDPTVQAFGQMMQGLLDQANSKGGELTEQFKTFLLQMEDRTKALQIAEAMGIELDEMGAKVTDGVAQAQTNFSKLPEVMQQIINSAKTPEELDAKLQAMNQIIGTRAAEGAQEFAKLPKGMAEAVAQDTISTQVTTIMGKVKQAISQGVSDAKTAWAELPKALSSAVTADSSIATAVQGQMTKVKTTITTGVTESTTAFKKLFTDMTAAAQSDQTPATVNENMRKIVTYIREQVALAVAEFKKLADQAASHGKLSGFVSAIQSAMSQAKAAVSSAVNEIVAQLNSLNRTFQGPTITVTTVKKTVEEGESGTNSLAPSPAGLMSLMASPEDEPVSLMAASAGANLDTLAEQAQMIASYAGAVGAERKKEGSVGSSPTVVKNYYFTINAAPNIPTEESLRRQLSYADALYE